jgi:hypothetical protein
MHEAVVQPRPHVSKRLLYIGAAVVVAVLALVFLVSAFSWVDDSGSGSQPPERSPGFHEDRHDPPLSVIGTPDR